MIQVSCISGTINRLPLLQRMIESVRQSVGTLTYEIILIDCNSTDGTREWIREQKDCVLIEHPEPRGSAIAFQDGFEHAKGVYCITLNDDITVEADTIAKAYAYMENNPQVGQAAFAHKYQNRKGIAKERPIVQKAFGYVYAQCGITRRHLGDIAGWCGVHTEGYIHYAWDNYLSSRLWEMGWQVVQAPGCAVIDYEHVDDIREQFSDKMRSDSGGVHPDTKKFAQLWRTRLPKQSAWISAPVTSKGSVVVRKAASGVLRTLRFKGMMAAHHTMRTAMIDEFKKYGPAKQINQTAQVQRLGMQRFQDYALSQVKQYQPDLVFLQAQRPNNVMPLTARRMCDTGAYVINWDGDTHYPLDKFHFDIAKAVDLQLTVSPTLFSEYTKHGVGRVGYWPIGVELEYMSVKRKVHHDAPDVVFLGALYGIGMFPEASTRRDAVRRLYHSNLKFVLHGNGWKQIGINSTYTGEQHQSNAELYARSKMALSVSQTAELWGYTSDRAYNICATGCPILIQRFVGMEAHGFVDGVSCIAWSTLDEMMDKAKYYIAHPKEREAIGQAGRELVLTRHNWGARVEALWSILGDLHEAQG